MQIISRAEPRVSDLAQRTMFSISNKLQPLNLLPFCIEHRLGGGGSGWPRAVAQTPPLGVIHIFCLVLSNPEMLRLHIKYSPHVQPAKIFMPLNLKEPLVQGRFFFPRGRGEQGSQPPGIQPGVASPFFRIKSRFSAQVNVGSKFSALLRNKFVVDDFPLR